MEQSSGSLTILLFVVTISFLIPIVLYHLKLRVIPVVVAEIITGLILGKSGFNIVVEDPWLTFLSLMGFIYLMFLSGLEINFDSFRKQEKVGIKGPNPLIMAMMIFLGIFLISGLLAKGLVIAGLVDRSFIMTLIISTISLGVVVPVLKEKKLLSNSLGQTILLVTVLADFFTMILLAIYVSWISKNLIHMLLLFIFFLSIVLIYLIIKRFATGKVFQVLSQGSVQFSTRAIFTLLLFIVFVSETLGVENILGAFLAGIIVSLLKPKQAFIHQLESFGYGFLIPIFFVMVGINLDLRPLLADKKILLLIPLLLLLIFVSKFVPVLLLKRWHTWREVFSVGVLLSAKLSLVIAASTLAFDLHIIDESLQGALILVAVLSCVIFPIIFNKIFPEQAERKPTIAIVGFNYIAMSVAQDLLKDSEYEVRLFSANNHDDISSQEIAANKLKIINIPELAIVELERQNVYQSDVLVFTTADDDKNIELADYVKKDAKKRVIIRIEDPELYKEMQQKGFTVFSTLFAARTVLRAIIENPSALQLIAEEDVTIYEVKILNPRYHQVLLQQLPLNEVLIMRIYRDDSFLIPHGNTSIQLNDRLLVSGQIEVVNSFKRKVGASSFR